MIRVLIADDASPDDTEAVSRELMRADSRVHYRRNPVNLRNIENYNTAFEWVTADLTAILSADDLMMAGALLRVATLMAAHPEVVMTYGRALYFTGPLDTAELLSGAIAARSCGVSRAMLRWTSTMAPPTESKSGVKPVSR